MSTTITKTGTSLAETSQEELQKLSQKAGMVPKTPAGAANIGANPDQAKMAGTPAQKASRIDGITSTPTLQQAQRISQPAPEAVTAPEKLDRMKQLGSLNTQVEGLVQGYLQQLQAQQASLALNQTTLGMVPESHRAPLEAALNEYKTALTEQQKEAATIKAGQALGRPLTQAEMTSYFAGAPDQLSNLAKNVTPESVSLRDLNLSAQGVNLAKLATDLGVSEDELAGLTLPQLNQKIEEIRQAEFAEADAAQAESLSAVGNRAQQLASERQAIGQSGRTGYEQQFERLQQDIESANTVKIGGQSLTIDKLLSDETISRLVSGAAISSSELAKLKETEPELAAWVEQYKSALIDLAKDAGLVAQDVADRQLEAARLRENVSSDLFMSIFGEKSDILSAEELESLKAEMQGSALWQAVNSDANLRARLELNPSMAESLKGLDTANIKTLMDATKAAEANSVLADLAGYQPGGLLTPAQADFVNQWRDEISTLPPAIASDKDFQAMIKSGEINESAAAMLAQSPELWDEYRAEQATVRELSRVQDEGDFLEMVTGDPGFGVKEFNDTMDMLKAWAATGNQEALDYYTRLQGALTGPDGRLDMQDVQNALQTMANSKASIGDVLGGKEGAAALLQRLTTDLGKGIEVQKNAATDPKQRVAMLAIDYLKNDQRIDANEMAKIINSSQFNTDSIKELLSSPWVPNKTELTEIYNSHVRSKAQAGMAGVYEQLKRLPGLKNFSVSGLTPQFTLDTKHLYDSLEQIPAYRGQLQSAIQELDRYASESANDPTYRQAMGALTSQLRSIDLLEGGAMIQKQLFPQAGQEFITNILSPANLPMLERVAAPGSNLSEPGLSGQQIFERFKAAYNGASALDINNAIARGFYDQFKGPASTSAPKSGGNNAKTSGTSQARNR